MLEQPIKKKRKDVSSGWFVASLFVPFGIISFIFFNGTQVGGILMSFQKDISGQTIWTFGNYTRIITEGFSTNGIFTESVRNSLLFFSLSMFVMTPINLVIGYFLHKKITGYKFFRIVLYLPNVLPGLIVATLFKYITAPDGAGVLASLFYKMGKEFPNLFGDSRYAIWSLLFYSFWSGFGSGFLLYASAMKRIPPEVLESAQLDGVGWIREITSIYMPLIWPTFSMMLIQMLPSIFESSGAVLFFTQGDYGTQTLSYWMFEQVKDRTNLNYSAAVGLFFSIITLPILFFSRWLLEKVPDVEY